MAIYRLLRRAAFDPEAINVMTGAYEEALTVLDLKDRADPLTELIAAKIIQIYRLGETDDPRRICQRSLRELGVATPE